MDVHGVRGSQDQGHTDLFLISNCITVVFFLCYIKHSVGSRKRERWQLALQTGDIWFNMKRTAVELPKDTMSSSEETENIKMLFHHQHAFIVSKVRYIIHITNVLSIKSIKKTFCSSSV